MNSRMLLPILVVMACTAVAQAQPDCSFPSVEPRHWYQDAFPSNETITATVHGPYDTTSAWVRTGLNLAQLTGTTGRQDLPGDTVVAAAAGANLRLDLVFRIVPGVGNFRTIGNRASGLRRVPTSNTAAVANAASTNFWESYLADNGAVGTGGDGTAGPGHPSGWDPNRWNSARCDTAEINIFPVDARLANMPALTPGRWASMYHEADPKYVTLGVPKNRCFLVDPAGAINSTNITCGTGTFPPPWTGNPNAGMTPSEGGLSPGVTREFSQIIPDGQLTPGAHVQYFLRVSDQSSPLASLGMNPDTNYVLGQGECSKDCARWAQFGVLPDRWKEAAFGAGGQGMACMLVVDLDDGGGDECAWVSIADSIGLSPISRRGAHNGWGRAPHNGSVNDSAYFIRAHLGQPGGLWDLYSVRGSRDTLTGNAGSLGSRQAPRCVGCPSSGRESRQGPTPEMLRMYRVVVVLTGHRSIQILGPLADRGQDDAAALQNFLILPGGSTQPRGLWIMGSGFGESESAGHPAFLQTYLRASLRSPDYVALSGNSSSSVLLKEAISSSQFGLLSNAHDVFNVIAAAPGGQVFSYYENVGATAPYVASVYGPNSGARPFKTLLDGFDLADLGDVLNMSTSTRRDYVHHVLIQSFAETLCFDFCGGRNCIGVEGGVEDATFLSLTGNPVRGGSATIQLAMPKAERAKVAIYDVSGRLLNTVMNRTLEKGSHTVTWDGTDASGARVASGVYWVHASTGSGVHAVKAVVMLR